jgi:hypothetical protein
MELTNQKLVVKESRRARRNTAVTYLIGDPFKRRLIPMRMLLV